MLIFLDRRATVAYAPAWNRRREGAVMDRSFAVWPLRAALAALLLAPSIGLALPQSTDQQNCINYMNKYGAKLGKDQNRGSVDCVKNAGRGNVTKLGIPPQAQTAQACLTNDVRGKIARDEERLADRDALRCLASPEQLPAFGYSGASATADGFRNAGLGIVASLFGANLDAAIVSYAADPDGARCQSDVLRYTTDLFYAMWKLALTAKRDALRGEHRVTGSNPDAPVASEADLEAELIAVVQADAKAKISKGAPEAPRQDHAAVHGRPDVRSGACFPGSCSGSPTLVDLASCTERVARGGFYQALAAADALSIDCDWTRQRLGRPLVRVGGAARARAEPTRLRPRRLVARPASRRSVSRPTSRSNCRRSRSTTARSTPS
jgi:hypothetical protein